MVGFKLDSFFVLLLPLFVKEMRVLLVAVVHHQSYTARPTIMAING